MSDRLALEQIVGNLLDNAVKYRGAGPRAAGIQIRAHETRGQRIIVEIEDNGRGIAAQDHERVFDLFRRSGAQDTPGEGIGLAHVRTHGPQPRRRRSRCDRELEQGHHDATATCRATCARFWPRKPEPHDVNKQARPVSIVMIEDDEGHGRLIEKNIRRAGVHNEIVPFANGTAALHYLLRRRRFR